MGVEPTTENLLFPATDSKSARLPLSQPLDIKIGRSLGNPTLLVSAPNGMHTDSLPANDMVRLARIELALSTLAKSYVTNYTEDALKTLPKLRLRQRRGKSKSKIVI